MCIILIIPALPACRLPGSLFGCCRFGYSLRGRFFPFTAFGDRLVGGMDCFLHVLVVCGISANMPCATACLVPRAGGSAVSTCAYSLVISALLPTLLPHPTLPLALQHVGKEGLGSACMRSPAVFTFKRIILHYLCSFPFSLFLSLPHSTLEELLFSLPHDMFLLFLFPTPSRAW